MRKQLANELNYTCRLDAHILSCTLETINKSIINDIQAHYRSRGNTNYPDKDGGLLLEELTKYLERAGVSDPMSKVYVTSEPLEYLPAALLLFLVTYMSKFQYNCHFGSLVREKDKYPIDGFPMAAGICTIMKQMHPDYLQQFLAMVGQYVRSMINAAGAAGYVVDSARLTINALTALTHSLSLSTHTI
jgi:WASH complex subunit strumpellin